MLDISAVLCHGRASQAARDQPLPTAVLCWVGVLAAPGIAQAQQPVTVNLEPIVVKGTPLEDASPNVIDEGKIRLQQPTTLNELFFRSSDVSVSGGNRTTAQKVYVRGLEDTRLNVTIDGAKTSGTLSPHNGNNGIDPFILKRVTVDAGPGSALSGPSALGGSIAYETKAVEDFLLPDERFGAAVRLSGQTNGERLSPGAAVYGMPDDRIGFVFYGSKDNADNYRAGNGEDVTYTDNEPLNLFAKLQYQPAEAHAINLSSIYREDNGLRAAQVNFGVDPSHPRATAEDQEHIQRTSTVSYEYAPASSPYVNLVASIQENETELRRLRASNQTASWRSRGANIQNRSTIGQFYVVYGVEYLSERSRGVVAATVDESETARSIGAFLQLDYSLSEQWQLSAGLRYDNSALTDFEGNDYDGANVSPNVGLTFAPIGGLTFSASWAEAFRGVQPAPGLNLMAGIDAGATDTSLEGEVSRAFELGVDYVWREFVVGVTAFQTDIEDVVLFGGRGGAPFSRSNGGKAEISGITANLGYHWHNWVTQASYTQTETTLGGRPVSPDDWYDGFAPQGDKLAVAVGYQFRPADLYLEWNSVFVFAERDLPESFTSADKLSGYHVHDVSLFWRPQARQEFSVAVTNLLDEAYVAHGTPYNVPGGTTNLCEMGRSARLTALLRF